MFRKTIILAYLALIPALSVPAEELFEFGRTMSNSRDDVFSVNFGSAFNVNTVVQAPEAGGGTPDYLEMSGPGLALGLSYEYIAWLVSFQIDAAYISISDSQSSGNPLYMKLGDNIGYGGGSYGYMQIPANTPFDTSFKGGTLDMNLKFHPLVINVTDTFEIVPSLIGGALLYGGEQSIDAGAPAGAARSSSQDRDYVVGGETSGMVSMAAPQVGFGCEVRTGGTEDFNQIFKLQWLFFGLIGDDLDHNNIRLSYRAEFPMQEYVNKWFIGLDFAMMDSTGKEEFNGSDVETSNFAMDTVMLSIGLTY